MKTRALRLYGAMDLRLEEFELPPIQEDEILVEIITDSLCMSSYKAAKLGTAHKRVPDDAASNPIILGHEFAGNIVQVGKRHQNQFTPGMKFTIQPALNYKGTMWSPGYSYPNCGGDATYAILPPEVMELGCLLIYQGDAYFEASLSEPLSCSAGAFHAAYHTKMGVYHHEMGIREGGRMAILGGAGPMGLGAIDYALHGDRRPSMLVVTDTDAARLARAAELFPREAAEKEGIALHFVSPPAGKDGVSALRAITPDGYDDVLVYTPNVEVLAQASAILGRDGCLNFFAGPTDTEFTAPLNYYDIHYGSTHVMGTSGGNTDDMKEALTLMAEGRIRPAVMVTHIGGLDSAADATLHLPELPGGKKLIYTHINMPLTAIDDFGTLGEKDARFAALEKIVARAGGLWCLEAEQYLLKHWD
ncbi:zinc-binding dehydrogenase [Eubacteriales bacterium OttesenSCG-928-A19]|nr:zinc-binding dehydrogenase [Eubacteriales bacterium OttesenSCG-928-A19]